MKSIFLDTNIFLHYKPFDQIDWCSIVKSEEISIIVPPITIRELNKQKELHPHKHIRERATKMLKKLNSLLSASNSNTFGKGNSISLEDRDPNIEYSSYGLQIEVQDDQLIASILFFCKCNPESDIILITSDDGLLLKAKARRYNINTLSLPEDHKLPQELDSQQKQIKELEEELLHLKTASPELLLTFEDGNDFFSYTIQKLATFSDESFDKQLVDLKQKFPYMGKQSLPNLGNGKNMAPFQTSLIQMMQSMNVGITDKDIEEYNSHLDEYFKRYHEFLKKDSKYQNMQRLTIEIKLFLSNDGTKPAEDIDVFLHFPNGFMLYNQKELPKQPQTPKPPEKPKSTIDMMLERPYLNNLIVPHSFMQTPPNIQPPKNVSSLKIRPSKSYDVEFKVIRLKHNLREPIGSLFVVYDSFESAKSFNIQCQILAGNLPHPVEEELHIIINKES
jgi:hypothetical protein